MKFTFYGHACFEIEVKGKRILFDPFITPNELAKDIDVNSIQPDYILISHGHEDHVADVEKIAKQSGAKVVSNFEIVSWFGNKGIEGHPMNHGGKWEFEFGTIKYVNAVHSSVLPDGTYGGNPGGFILYTDEGNIYFAGDTALTYDMKLLANDNIDIAILPVGDNFTMGVDDAVTCSDFINCSKIIGVHFDTFGYIKINHEEAIKKFANKNKELTLPSIGQTISF